jgi:hypothetical protein
VKALVATVPAIVLTGCLVGPDDDPGHLTEGALTANEEVLVLEDVVRYGLRNARRPCSNYGSKEAYCLSVRETDEDPPGRLLLRLADIRPPVIALSECRRQGIVGPRVYTVDPTVNVEWLKVLLDTSIRARVIVSCSVSEPTLRRQGSGWALQGSGWVGCGPLPTDCAFQ